MNTRLGIGIKAVKYGSAAFVMKQKQTENWKNFWRKKGEKNDFISDKKRNNQPEVRG